MWTSIGDLHTKPLSGNFTETSPPIAFTKVSIAVTHSSAVDAGYLFQWITVVFFMLSDYV